MDIGTQLRTLRVARGLSQKDLADALGRAQTTISKYENGEREPDFSFLRDASKFFGKDFSFAEKVDYRDMVRNQYNDSIDLISMGYDPEDARRMERENFERYGDMIMSLSYDNRKKVETFISNLKKGGEEDGIRETDDGESADK